MKGADISSAFKVFQNSRPASFRSMSIDAETRSEQIFSNRVGA
jgi:hypothetical protein